MQKSLTKRAVAWLLAAMVALVVAPSSAFAADLVAGTAVTPQADGVLKVYEVQADGTAEVAKDFTQAELDALAKKNTSAQSYVFMNKDKLNVAVATKYVTIDQLAAEAGITLEDADEIYAKEAVAEDDTKSFAGNPVTYASMKDGKFFPNYTTGSGSSANAEATTGIVAFEWGDEATTDAAVTAGSLVNTAKANSKSSTIRNFWGKTADDLSSGNTGGKSYVKGTNELYISKAFKVYTRTGNGDKTLVKAYGPSSLNALATASEEGQGFLFNKEGWQVGVTTSYIPVADLLKDAGLALKSGQSIQATASDGFSSILSYDQVSNGKYFYPATTSSKVVASGAEEVGTVLALNWGTTAATPTAGTAKKELAAKADELVQQTRIFTGLASASDPNTGGNRFATGPVELTLVTLKDISDSSITVSGIEASYDYTGAAIEPTVTVKDGTIELVAVNPDKPKKGGDYKVSYENNTEAGTGKVIIEGSGTYTGTKTIEFAIAKKSVKDAAVTLKNKTYTGKVLAPAPVVKVNGTKLVAGTDYTMTIKNAKGKNVSAKKIKTAGTYTVTIEGKGLYEGSLTKTYKIVKAKNTMTAQAKAKTNTVKYSKLKTKAQVITKSKAFKISKAKGKVTFNKKSGNKKITVNKKTGKITVKKGLKKGTYKVKVKIKAAGTTNYKALTKTVTLKIKVK